MELPSEFIHQMLEQMPQQEVDALCSALCSDPMVSIRLNDKSEIARSSVCRDFGINLENRVPWCESGLYLPERPSFTMNPLFHSGAFYVQEASSMFVEQAVRKCVGGPVRVLDLCAAPGGKSTHLLSLLPEGSLLVANEIIRSRANILRENIVKWGRANVVVTNDTPAHIGGSPLMYDLILVDAPCSGEGMFRKDDVAVSEWSSDNVQMCAARQREILEAVWPVLKPGGHIIYSTCTFNRFEDEDNVAWMIGHLGAEIIGIEVREDWNIKGDMTGRGLPVYHFMPHLTRGEGFFLSLLRKPGSYTDIPLLGKTKTGKCEGQFTEWLAEPESFRFVENDDSVMALPECLADDMLRIERSLNTVSCGLGLAVRKGRNWTPAHSLAMSRNIRKDAFSVCDLSREQALAYLHGESVTLSDAPRGYVLVTYSGVPLGFANNVGNRANNLYPQQWRIRKQIC